MEKRKLILDNLKNYPVINGQIHPAEDLIEILAEENPRELDYLFSILILDKYPTFAGFLKCLAWVDHKNLLNLKFEAIDLLQLKNSEVREAIYMIIEYCIDKNVQRDMLEKSKLYKEDIPWLKKYIEEIGAENAKQD